jgi:hypothetical protein
VSNNKRSIFKNAYKKFLLSKTNPKPFISMMTFNRLSFDNAYNSYVIKVVAKKDVIQKLYDKEMSERDPENSLDLKVIGFLFLGIIKDMRISIAEKTI